MMLFGDDTAPRSLTLTELIGGRLVWLGHIAALANIDGVNQRSPRWARTPRALRYQKRTGTDTEGALRDRLPDTPPGLSIYKRNR